MPARMIPALLLMFISSTVFAQEANRGPIIEDYGNSFFVEDRDVPLVDGHQYQVVFELTKYSTDMTAMNRELDRVARFLNLHAGQGVPRENMDVVVVVHGATLISLLNDEAYEEKYGHKNPNLDLVNQLAEAGVDIFACGQSLGFRGWNKSELASPVKVGMSAMTLVNVYQSKGYNYQL
jgi:intracellular sulfur oxidation DsrE/DsrF family protein